MGRQPRKAEWASPIRTGSAALASGVRAEFLAGSSGFAAGPFCKL